MYLYTQRDEDRKRRARKEEEKKKKEKKKKQEVMDAKKISHFSVRVHFTLPRRVHEQFEWMAKVKGKKVHQETRGVREREEKTRKKVTTRKKLCTETHPRKVSL